MTILVTGASGQLGRLVLDDLLDRGVVPAELRAGARTPGSLQAYAERGVDVVHLDYSDPVTAKSAVEGADQVLLISGPTPGERVGQHAAVIDATASAGVGHLVYTSATRADDTPLVLAPDHLATEELIRASGVRFTILRNNWYTENYAQALATAREYGVLVTSAGTGRVASAPRSDYAGAAAVVLTDDGHDGEVLELGGDLAWSFEELASAFAQVLGRSVELRQLGTEGHVEVLERAGLDAGTAGFVAALDGNIRDGALSYTDGSLARLLGRPTTPLVEALRRLP